MLRKESKELREREPKIAFQFKEIIPFLFLKWHIQLFTKYYIELTYFFVRFFNRPPPFSSVMKPMELEVQADIESYSSGANSNRGNGSSQNPLTGNSNNPAIDNTPTNAEVSLLKKACDDDSDLESLYPSVPLRTSSILPRPGMFYGVNQNI